MKKKIKILGAIILILIGVLLYIFFDEKYSEYYPLSIILIIIFLLFEKIVIEIKLKQKKWIRYGKEWIDKKHLILNVIIGLVFILLGHLAIEKHFVWKNIDVRVFIGLGFIAAGLIGIRNYVIIIKQDSIFINGDNKSFDFKSSNFKLAEINDDKLKFTNGKNEIDVSMDRLNQKEIDDIKLKFIDNQRNEILD